MQSSRESSYISLCVVEALLRRSDVSMPLSSGLPFIELDIRYLLSMASIREKDLYELERPVQIGDVLVLPIDGFKYAPDRF